ncbi:MAG: hypothetical protein GY723_21755 [bacterium]|nr:hypothetical protein [bacterium]
MSENPTIPDGPPAVQRNFQDRVIGALMLDATVFEEVEHDESSLGQAATVVAIAAVAGGIGALGSGGVTGLIGGVVLAGLAWVIGAAVVWLVGVQMMGHSSDLPQLLRTLGFASAPGVLRVLGIIPLLGWIAALAAAILSLIAWVIAVRQALDVDTGQAVLVCVLAFFAQLAIGVVLAFMGFGMLATAG